MEFSSFCDCTKPVCFHRLEKLLESLLSTLKGTELWDGTPSVIPQFEQIIRSLVNTVQAQNGEYTTEQQGCCLTFVYPRQVYQFIDPND